MASEVIAKSFCTTREAATLLGVSVGTVQLWVESGLLRAWKTAGGHRRVMRDSVERLLRKVPDILDLRDQMVQGRAERGKYLLPGLQFLQRLLGFKEIK